MAITSYFKTYQQMGLINVALLPMFLFSGSLYPIFLYILIGLVQIDYFRHGMALN